MLNNDLSDTDFNLFENNYVFIFVITICRNKIVIHEK